MKIDLTLNHNDKQFPSRLCLYKVFNRRLRDRRMDTIISKTHRVKKEVPTKCNYGDMD